MDQVQRILELLDEVEEKFDSLVGRINSILSHVPFFLQWAADKFRDLWDGVVAKWHEFWEKVGEFISYLGAPWDLDSAKDAWNALGGPVAERASEADRSQSEVDFEWKGRAADRYALSLGAQRSALTAVRDKLTSQIGPALGSLASAIYIFYGAVIAAIVILAAGLLTATGEAISVLGLPAVPPTVITAIVAAVAALSAAILNLRSQATSAQSAFDDVANETSDFGAGGWPRAVI